MNEIACLHRVRLYVLTLSELVCVDLVARPQLGDAECGDVTRFLDEHFHLHVADNLAT